MSSPTKADFLHCDVLTTQRKPTWLTTFRYEHLTEANAIETGLIEAGSIDEAREMLLKAGKTVLSVGKESSWKRIWSRLNEDLGARRPLSVASRAELFHEWGQLFHAGLPVADGVAITASGAGPKLREKIAHVVQALRNGASLAGAIERLGPAFPPQEIALIRSGEAAGALAPTLQRLARELQDRVRARHELVNTFTYPAFTVVAAILAVVILLVTIVPALEQLLDGRTDAGLPYASHLMIGFSRVLRAHGLLLLVGFFVLGVSVVSLVAFSTSGRRLLERISLKLPYVGRASQAFEAASYLRSLSVLADQGMPLGQAMALSSGAFVRLSFREKAEQARQFVMAGQSVSGALRESGCCPLEALRLVAVGERTGRLPAMLLQAALVEENLGKRRMEALSRALGPALTIGVGALVGLIAYTMMTTILAINALAGV